MRARILAQKTGTALIRGPSQFGTTYAAGHIKLFFRILGCNRFLEKMGEGNRHAPGYSVTKITKRQR